jgi:23S rRNA (cytosine1962-C5)-methyltransferase
MYLKENYLKLEDYILSNGIEAYRLFHTNKDYPFSIDIYLNFAVIYNYTNTIDKDKLKEAQEFLKQFLSIPIQNQILKFRTEQKNSSQYEKMNQKKEYFRIYENGYSILVNLEDYLDTGIFLDHRETRKMVQSMSQNMTRVLNLFSYTSSFSIAASTGGAEFTTSVDMSNTYCNWSKENFKLNNMHLGKNIIIRDNIFFFLENINPKWRFDLIIIDPPTFSRSKKMLKPFDIQKDYSFLINRCLEFLNKNSKILFSTNFTKFKLESSKINSTRIEEITDKTIPPDFYDSMIHKTYLIYN